MEENRKLLDRILMKALEMEASDIHLTVGIPPAFRIHKRLERIEDFPRLMPSDTEELARDCLSSNKFRELNDTGEVDTSYSIPGIGRYRVNVYRQRGTYAMAIRQQPFEIPNFEELLLPESIRNLADMDGGLIIFSGTTGSGKSTSMASLINYINENYDKHIITIEDPIEYLHKHKKSIVNQREIGNDSDSYNNALRSALREDPDVILIGEMRDLDSIKIAITAAETGHLVISSLHTLRAANTIDRIVDVFPAEQQNQIRMQLSKSLVGVVSQQLVPRADEKGVVPIVEVFIQNTASQNLIREGKIHQLKSIIQTGQRHGMITFEESLKNLYTKGLISRETMMNRLSVIEKL